MSENPTSLMCRAAIGGAVVAAALALPTSALAGGKDDDDHDHDHKGKSVVCSVLAKHKHHWQAIFCPPPPPAPAPAPAPAPPATVTVTAPAGVPVIQVTNNVGASGSGPAAGQITTPVPVDPNAVVRNVAASGAPVSAQANSVAAGPCEARQTFRLSLHKGAARAARVLLNGRAIPVTRGKKSTSVLLDMRGRKNQSFTVRHTVVTKAGKLKTGTRRFRTCG